MELTVPGRYPFSSSHLFHSAADVSHMSRPFTHAANALISRIYFSIVPALRSSSLSRCLKSRIFPSVSRHSLILSTPPPPYIFLHAGPAAGRAGLFRQNDYFFVPLCPVLSLFTILRMLRTSRCAVCAAARPSPQKAAACIFRTLRSSLPAALLSPRFSEEIQTLSSVFCVNSPFFNFVIWQRICCKIQH